MNSYEIENVQVDAQANLQVRSINLINTNNYHLLAGFTWSTPYPQDGFINRESPGFTMKIAQPRLQSKHYKLGFTFPEIPNTNFRYSLMPKK